MTACCMEKRKGNTVRLQADTTGSRWLRAPGCPPSPSSGGGKAEGRRAKAGSPTRVFCALGCKRVERVGMPASAGRGDFSRPATARSRR